MRESSALTTTDPGLESIDLNGSSSETAASLISLAGGALDIHQRQLYGGWTGQGEHSSDSVLLRPMVNRLQGGNAPGNDEKHTTSPPVDSMVVLAELAATKAGPPQQGIWRWTSKSREAFCKLSFFYMFTLCLRRLPNCVCLRLFRCTDVSWRWPECV